MADMDYRVEAIGQVYAQALVNLADKQGVLEQVAEDVRGIGQLLGQNETLARFMGAVMLGPEEKLSGLEKIFGGRVHPLMFQTMASMARRDRLMFFSGLVAAFETIMAARAGKVDVELTVAQELPTEVLERVRAGVARSLGKDPQMTVKVDAALIGGMRLRVEDTMIDGSVSGQLEQMREHLRTQGAGQLQRRMETVIGSSQ